MLSDSMLDLDQPVVVVKDGRELFKGVVPRSAQTLHKALEATGDPRLMFDAEATVKITP